MFKEEEFNNFLKEMELGIEENNKYYDDTWKKEELAFLEKRLSLKFNEFIATRKPSKLISLANLAMMVYIRHKKGE